MINRFLQDIWLLNVWIRMMKWSRSVGCVGSFLRQSWVSLYAILCNPILCGPWIFMYQVCGVFIHHRKTLSSNEQIIPTNNKGSGCCRPELALINLNPILSLVHRLSPTFIQPANTDFSGLSIAQPQLVVYKFEFVSPQGKLNFSF